MCFVLYSLSYHSSKVLQEFKGLFSRVRHDVLIGKGVMSEDKDSDTETGEEAGRRGWSGTRRGGKSNCRRGEEREETSLMGSDGDCSSGQERQTQQLRALLLKNYLLSE